jgi:hypothetical protein
MILLDILIELYRYSFRWRVIINNNYMIIGVILVFNRLEHPRIVASLHHIIAFDEDAQWFFFAYLVERVFLVVIEVLGLEDLFL